MIKYLYTVAALFFVTTILHAQIPNPGFENWNGLYPVGWISNSNGLTDTPVFQSSNAHSGNYAVRMNGAQTSGAQVGGTLTSDNNGRIFYPLSSLPVALHGWYIGNVVNSGDALYVTSDVTINGAPVILAGGGITQSTTVYKEFVFNYSTSSTTGADSVSFELGVENLTSPLSPNTYFIVDDLSFGAAATTGIAETDDNAVLEQCSPNPTTGIANIIYSIATAGTTSIVLYDMTGQKVRTLLADTEQVPGRYKIPTDVSGLPAGVYIYILTIDGRSYSQKLVVAK
jgi:hypothetical protein